MQEGMDQIVTHTILTKSNTPITHTLIWEMKDNDNIKKLKRISPSQIFTSNLERQEGQALVIEYSVIE